MLLDFENIVLGMPQSTKFRPDAVLERILEMGKIVVKRAYADWSRYSKEKIKLHELGFDLLEIPKRGMSGKNSADIRLVIDAFELLMQREHIDTYALVTGDSDFTPLSTKLREYDKRVVGIGVKAASSKLLIDSCDEFIFYDEIEAEERASEGPLAEKLTKGAKPGDKERRRAEGLVLVLKTIRPLLRDYDTVWSSMIKQTIVRKQPQFNEAYHGYSTFTAMIEDAVNLKLLKGDKDDKSGNWRITGLGDKASQF